MRRDGVVQYLHADHLGSTSLATDENGVEAPGSHTLYYPYGEERWSASGGTLTTDYGFTGQRRERGIGLYDYNARFYDPVLGRFISADTIVPDPGNPQSLNRYSYVLGNPLRYIDPSGHLTEDALRQLLGDNYDYLINLWRETDPYFYDVIFGEELQSGDFLEASMLEGQLLFQEIDGVMQVFAHDGASTTNLWDWQGKGSYTINGDAKLSDQIFSANMHESSNSVYAFYYQPVFKYNSNSRGVIAEFLGSQSLDRYTTVQPTGLIEQGINKATGHEIGPAIDLGVDVLLTAGGALHPFIGAVGVGKFIIDVGVTGYTSLTDPVYSYNVRPRPEETRPNPIYCLGW
ncbi:MAG: RHS repeat-associated core domain-containing protein [Chloroflexi bacterium]|nr:RHS repeat-associated core domain-containing protein [Chloroflexota bacterium]